MTVQQAFYKATRISGMRVHSADTRTCPRVLDLGCPSDFLPTNWSQKMPHEMGPGLALLFATAFAGDSGAVPVVPYAYRVVYKMHSPHRAFPVLIAQYKSKEG